MTCDPAAFTAFQGTDRLAAGPAAEVALAVRAAQDRAPEKPVLIFDDRTGRQVDFDLRGSPEEIRARLAAPAETTEQRGPGRPRLGVAAREVTLLPRHWDWLNAQPGGASVALRRLVEAARTSHAAGDAARLARQAADAFMLAMAGNLPGYEAASRALYAGDRARFEAETAAWPADLRAHARRLAAAGLGPEAA
ncbi:MAG: DUF2239 family protein [Paracraurococcus sp.]|jgi:uncharacterized protein